MIRNVKLLRETDKEVEETQEATDGEMNEEASAIPDVKMNIKEELTNELYLCTNQKENPDLNQDFKIEQREIIDDEESTLIKEEMKTGSFLNECEEMKSETIFVKVEEIENEEIPSKKDEYIEHPSTYEDFPIGTMENPGEGTSYGSSRKTDEYFKAQFISQSNRKKNQTFDQAAARVLCPDWDNSDLECSDMSDYENEGQFIEGPKQNTEAKEGEDFPPDISAERENTLRNNLKKHPHSEAALNENDLPLAGAASRPRVSKAANIAKWSKINFEPPRDVEWKDDLIVDPLLQEETPIFFFSLIFGDKVVQHIHEQTLTYALQKTGSQLNVTKEDLKVFLGILLIAGIVKAPTHRAYWEEGTRFSSIADSMSKHKFETIKRYLHFNNNVLQKPAEDSGYDKLFKIRPLYDLIRRNCRAIQQEEHQCVGQHIIPCGAKGSLRQFNTKRTRKLGYEMFIRAGESGIVYDFIMYTGIGTVVDIQENAAGIGGNFVIALCEGVPENKNYKLYYDNWFSSLSLAKVLKNKGIYSCATMRANRLKGCLLTSDSEMKKLGRGSFDYRVDKNSNCVALKWYDNKPIYVLSSFVGTEPTDVCRHWDASNKTYVDVPIPMAMKEYNKFIGGVELCARLLELYRADFRSSKYYMQVFLYLLDLSVVNAWLLYRRAYQSNSNKYKLMSLCKFKSDIAHGLMMSNFTLKRRRPPSGTLKSTRPKTEQPSESLRFDTINHLPEYVQERLYCKKCSNRTQIKCAKCNVGLCLNKSRNCYSDFHCK